MATLIPSLDKIKQLKVKPEEGELYLLSFLDRVLDESFEVFFNPYMNGDRPDIVIMRKGQGVLIIEVKDYKLDSYELDKSKNFVIKNNKTKTHKSPISQVLKYKDNLFELHIDRLLELKIKDIRNFNIVACAVYFHNASKKEIDDFLVTPFEYDRKYQDFLKYNIDLLGRDSLNEKDFNTLLRNRYLISQSPSMFFTDDIYDSFSRFLKPTVHLKEEGEDFHYSEEQSKIIYDDFKIQSKLIKGVVGSGKTTVLAARAVQNYKKTLGKILILTYNITLRNFIRDKISKVREEFPWDSFIITNYHYFITSELNNLGIPIEVPEGFNDYTEEEKEKYFETRYYSNTSLFAERKEDIPKFDAILIDEIQDYKRPWMEIIKDNFLQEGAEYILFGDVKQNIYNNKIENKDLVTNIGKGGSVRFLKRCYRSDYKIKDLAIAYQKTYFEDKYLIDNFNEKPTLAELPFERNQLGEVNYIYLPSGNNIQSLYTIIHQNAINKGIPPNDITILSQTIKFLRDFDCYYRYASNEKTNTMFETNEMIYKMGLNFIGSNQPDWIKEAIKLMGRERDSRNIRAYNQLSVLLAISDLVDSYGNLFIPKLEFFCKKYGTTINKFSQLINDYNDAVKEFKKDFGPNRMTKNLKLIRDNKKIHFYLNSGTLKLSTVHSFKGWESELLFLIIEKKYHQDTEFEQSFDEIIYTGLTRSRANLIIINYGNNDYHSKLKELTEKVNS